ncbi:zinc finger protein 765-like [Cydia fagiglandana]|uniref:zinc finger protein 765-like n=1 Tax=Cydia fagiglandana TaxID=1458189 RepID=UPI002FEDE731
MNCEICSAKFVSSAALDRHTDTAGEHKDLRPCEQCGENCASEDALQKHVEDTHSKESIRCDVCSISFPNTEAYTTHVSRSHLQERMVIKQSRQYREWKKQKTLMKKTELVCEQSPGVKKTEVMCEQCGDKFPFPSQLKLHQQKYHQALKPYLCNECAKGFSSKAGLEDHIRSHTGEKPYNCKHCSLAFSMRGNLNRHHNTVHLGLRGCFACDICGSTVSTKSSLRLHIETKHGGRDWPRSRKRQQAQKLKEKLTINKDRK